MPLKINHMVWCNNILALDLQYTKGQIFNLYNV